LIRTGPDAGRCSWQLNDEPGAPPNPARVNRRPDIGRRFGEILTQVRNDIHNQPEPELPAAAPHPLELTYTDRQDASPIELALCAELLNTSYRN